MVRVAANANKDIQLNFESGMGNMPEIVLKSEGKQQEKAKHSKIKVSFAKL
jgi:hypothetical protein